MTHFGSHPVRCGGVFFLFLLASSFLFAEPLNLLFFGNSFTYYNDLADDLGRLAVADGYDTPNIVEDTLGGARLSRHISVVASSPTDNVNHSSISGDTWDFMVIQGQSREATDYDSGQTPAKFQADAVQLYTDVRDHSSGRGAGVTAVLYQTWAYNEDHSIYPAGFSSPTAMQSEITAGYALAESGILSAGGAGSVRVAPSGEAFASQGFDDGLYNSDNFHPSGDGSLLSSMVLYRTIYGEKVGDIDYTDVSGWAGVSESTWDNLASAADAMVIPEPSSLWMLTLGSLGVLYTLRRQRNASSK